MEKNKLEAEFLELIKSDYDKMAKKVEKLIAASEEALAEAEKIVSESGFSYYFPISPLGQTFSADSEKLLKKYHAKAKKAIDMDDFDIDELQEAYDEHFGGYGEMFIGGEYGAGWTHSAVCQ